LQAAIGRWPAPVVGHASVAFAITNQIRNEIDDVLADAPAAAKPALERVRDIVSAGGGIGRRYAEQRDRGGRAGATEQSERLAAAEAGRGVAHVGERRQAG
jgi:hypothetical protein